jgi:hypothetical protein
MHRIATHLRLAEFALRKAQEMFDGSDRARRLYAAVRAEYELAELLAAKAQGRPYFVPLR